jgi:hypothetical protein
MLLTLPKFLNDELTTEPQRTLRQRTESNDKTQVVQYTALQLTFVFSAFSVTLWFEKEPA